MLDKLDCVYVFKRESELRIKVSKLVLGKPAGSYFLIGNDACTCPGFQKTSRCKHRKMWEGVHVEDTVKVHEVEEMVHSIAQTVGIPIVPPTESDGGDATFEEIGITTLRVPKLPYDLVVCVVPVGSKKSLIEIRRLNNATGSSTGR